ncbi:hypothetical protein M8C21_031287 [Ambrosia artemisiifolia]|uniref:Uncharacterized protein n=1 Tax=Ambrosia artemisiifolia TaxID=4212 RepID=A0AAD5G787_AMBAR|nr:hypothetical protein M8C21_031287 [Ambrosia artemisiifolia]
MEDPRETDSFDEEDEHYDTVCAICENGGELVWYYFLLH